MWRSLRLQALADSPYAFGSRLSQWQGADEARWQARLDITDSANFVALLDDRAVGMASGMPDSSLTSLWVQPDARGHGIGDRLIGAVEEWAIESGSATLRLSVMPGNAAAIGLYRRNGFVETDEPGDLLPDGSGREIVMAKPLL